MKSILALDLATRTGWAYAPAGTVVFWPVTAMEARTHKAYTTQVRGGTVAFDQPDLGMAYRAFGQWLEAKLTVLKPDLVGFEAPMVQHSSQQAARKLLGLAAVCEYVCVTRDTRIVEVHLGTVKKSFTGHGSAKKPDMIAEARARGFTPKDDNHADAIAVLNKVALDVVTGQRRAA